MSDCFRVVCTEQEPYWQSAHCAKIIKVGISNGADLATESITVAEVILRMAKGDVFYTVGMNSGKTALVEKYWCNSCRKYHIRSAADCVKDNNLDELRFCNWKKAA